jgi:hypothetical protein
MTRVEKLLIVALGVIALSFLGYIVGPAPMLRVAVSATPHVIDIVG